MKRLNNLLIIFLFAFISSCGQNKISFSVDIPQTWQLIESTNKYQERQVKIEESITESSASFPRNILVGIIHADELHGYINAYLSQLEQSTIFYKKLESGSTTIDGREAQYIRYQIQINTERPMGEQKVYFVEKHNRIFQIVCSSRPNEISSFQNEIEFVIKSLKLLP
jgi:PsbP-like protein